jgi:hypothetical protein
MLLWHIFCNIRFLLNVGDAIPRGPFGSMRFLDSDFERAEQWLEGVIRPLPIRRDRPYASPRPADWPERSRVLADAKHLDAFRRILAMIPDPFGGPNAAAAALFEWARYYLGTSPTSWNFEAKVPADFSYRFQRAWWPEGAELPRPEAEAIAEKRRFLIEAGLLLIAESTLGAGKNVSLNSEGGDVSEARSAPQATLMMPTGVGGIGPDGWPEPDYTTLPADKVAKADTEPESFSGINEPRFQRHCQGAWSAASQLRGIIRQLRNYYTFVVPCLTYVFGRVLKSGGLREMPLEVEVDRVRDVCLRALLRLRIDSPSFVAASFEALVGRFPTHLPPGQVTHWKEELDRHLESHGPMPIDEAQPNRVRQVMPGLPEDIATRLAGLDELEDELLTFLETLEHMPDFAFVEVKENAGPSTTRLVSTPNENEPATPSAQGTKKRKTPTKTQMKIIRFLNNRKSVDSNSSTTSHLILQRQVELA